MKRVLNVVLTDQSPRSSLDGTLDGALDGVWVDEVLPIQGCGHLMVRVAIPTDSAAGNVLAALRTHTPRLRSELARSISRKRVPELSFMPTLPAEDQYD